MQTTATTEHADNSPERSWTDTGGHPPKVTELRAKLYGKAKKEPGFRFYSLFGQILRRDVMWAAWCQVASNDGSPGVDGVNRNKTSVRQVSPATGESLDFLG